LNLRKSVILRGRNKISDEKPSSEKAQTIDKETLEWLLKRTLEIPRLWLIIGSFFVILSLFEVAWIPGEGLSLNLHVTYTTAIFLGLLWLPALIRLFVLRGGEIKTPVGEMKSP
jgi:hypothetical protein